jgi:plasmid stability protein
MGQILIRQLDDEVIAQLKARAKSNGRSTEAEAREALKMALESPAKPRPLAELLGAGKKWGRSKEEIDAYIRNMRDEKL